MRISDWSSDVCSSDLRDLAFGIWGSFMPVGIAMALLIGPLLEGWRPFWLANAGLAVVAAVLVVLLVRRDDQTTERLSWRGVGSDARATTMAGGPLLLACSFRSEEGRVGKTWVSRGKSRWAP